MSNTTNNYYKVRTNYYDNYTRKENTEGIIYSSTTNSDHPYHLNVTTWGGINSSMWMPCVSLEFTGNDYTKNEEAEGIKIGEGFNCTFRTDSFFEDSNGYNGCIGFAWTNQSLGNDAVPPNPYGSNFSTEVRRTHEGNQYGLWSESIKNENIKGFTLTLYPETTNKEDDGTVIPSIHQFTSKVSHYVLSYKKPDGVRGKIEDYLSECIDLYYENSISVDHAFGKYNFYLNGKLFESIDDDCIDIDSWEETDGYFTAAFLAAPYLEANLEIMD